MYNILEVEDKIKGLPDQALMREAQFPSGDVPQFLVVSEIQRRNEMRKSYDAMQQPTSTVPVAQQIVAEAGQGIAGVGGNALPVSAPMQAQTTMAPPMQSSMAAPQAPAGIVGMQSGRTVPGISTGGPSIGLNNPFNLRDYNQNWMGQTGATDGFVDFSSVDYGIRAADRLLSNYDVSTIEDLISKYAPSTENDTEAYIDFVSSYTGIGRDTPIDVGDPDVRRSIESAIAKMETGLDISPSDITAAVDRASSDPLAQSAAQIIAQRPEIPPPPTYVSPADRRAERLEETRVSRIKNDAREAAFKQAVQDFDLTIPEARDFVDNLYISDAGDVQVPRALDPDRVPSRTAASSSSSTASGITELIETYPNVLSGAGNPDIVPPPANTGNALSEDLSRMNSGIMAATKEGRDIISSLRTQLEELQPYQATVTDRQYIADDIDRQSYIDRLSAIAAEDVTARESLIDELQEKSKKDALNAFLISLGAGIAGGDISKGIEEGGKAAMDVKQLAEQRVFAEQKALRDVKSAAEREAVQLGLSAEEAALAGDRAAQQFDMQQESLRNTAEFQNYTVARDSLINQLAAAREDVTTIAALMKSEADIVNDANRIKADMEAEEGRERRNIRDYIGDLVAAQRETLEASVVGMTDPSVISQVVENYRNALEAALGLPSSRVAPSTFQLSGSPSAVDELTGFSINR
jgi:hypothetical protein